MRRQVWMDCPGGSTYRGRSVSALVCAAVALLVSAGAAGAQSGAAAGAAASEEQGTWIDSTVQPEEPVGRATSSSALRQRWASPFGVISSGTLSSREPRAAVVPRVSPEHVAAVADSGQSVAVVRVLEGEVAEEGADEAAAMAEVASENAEGAEGDAEGGERDAEGAAEETEGEVEEEAAPAPEAKPRTHQVAYGETWYGLARRFGVSSRALAAANPDVDPERLRAGTLLTIPPEGSSAGTSRRHTVGRGDTLFGIARRYGVSADAIRSANRMTDDIVRLGQTLVIPQEETSR